MNGWLLLGLFGQALFTGRFFLQWIASETRGESVIPVAFWYWSLGGSLVLLVYALHNGDPVFILGQSSGLIVYVRNLVLIGRKRRTEETAP